MIVLLLILITIYLIVVWTKLNAIAENQTRLEEQFRQLRALIKRQPEFGEAGLDTPKEAKEIPKPAAPSGPLAIQAEPVLPAVPEPHQPTSEPAPPSQNSEADLPEPPAGDIPERLQQPEPEPVSSGGGQFREIPAQGPTRAGGPPPAWWLPLRDFFSGPTGLARVGAVLVVAGLASLLAYALQQQYLQIPLEAWVVLAALAGMAAVGIGYRHTGRRRAFGLTLQGAGLGTVFLSAYASLRLFGEVSPFLLLAIMVVVAVAAGLLAVAQNSLALAVLALLGGFVAPLLVSGDSEGTGIFLLLGYYAVLDVAILTMAWHRDWRVLSWLGLVFTYGVGIFWGLTAYRPQYLGQSEVFVWLYFVLFMAAGILFSRRNGKPELIMLFVVPSLTLAVQAGLVANIPYVLAASSLVIAAAYVGAGYWARSAGMRTLVTGLVLAGAVFAAAAVPLALPGRWTALVWAAGGLAALALGARRQIPAAANLGLLLELAAWPAYFYGLSRSQPEPGLAFYVVVGAFMVVGARELWRSQSKAWGWLLVSGLGFGLALGSSEVTNYNWRIWPGYFAAFSLALATYLRFTGFPAWPYLRYYFPILLLAYLSCGIALGFGAEISAWWFLWLGAWLVGYWLLRQGEPAGESWWESHLAGLWGGVILTLIGLDQLLPDSWPGIEMASWLAAPALFLLLPNFPALRQRWPLAQHLKLYYGWGLTPLVVGAGLTFIGACFQESGLWGWAESPMLYLPLLNPLDLSSALFLLGFVLWARQIGLHMYFAGALALLWLTAITGRTVWNYSAGAGLDDPWGFGYSLVNAFANPTFVWLISVVWAAAALLVMLYSVRQGERRTWQAGLAILGLVMAKVVFIDLADLGTLERGLSFLGVGAILLLIGYLVPIPPREASDE